MSDDDLIEELQDEIHSLRQNLDQYWELVEAVRPIVDIAAAWDTKSLTSVDDRLYSPDGLVHLRLSDCKRIRKIVEG